MKPGLAIALAALISVSGVAFANPNAVDSPCAALCTNVVEKTEATIYLPPPPGPVQSDAQAAEVIRSP